jgi:hypothetical protein
MSTSRCEGTSVSRSTDINYSPAVVPRPPGSGLNGQSRFGLEQIPKIAVEIPKHRDGAVALVLRVANKGDAFGLVGTEVAPEIVGVKEKRHAATGLIANVGDLLCPDGACEQDLTGIAAVRSDDDPALVLFRDIRIFNQSEPQRADVKLKGLVVVTYNDGNDTDRLIHVEIWGGLTECRMGCVGDKYASSESVMCWDLGAAAFRPVARRCNSECRIY